MLVGKGLQRSAFISPKEAPPPSALDTWPSLALELPETASFECSLRITSTYVSEFQQNLTVYSE